MLIRSQDRLQLIPIDNGSISIGYKDSEDNKRIYFYDTGCSHPTSTLGLYQTKEKAIKVLDMITNTYTGSCYTENAFAGTRFILSIIKNNVVFEMPQDSEVGV